LKFLVEAWRGGCIRVWLRGAGFRLGQAVVRWQQAAVLQQSVALWRTICVKHYAQFSVQQLFAAESLGRAIAKSQKNALRQWSMQALKIATAQMQNKVKKLDMLHLGNLFNANVGAEVEHRRWHLRTIFEAWRLGRQQMMFTLVCLALLDGSRFPAQEGSGALAPPAGDASFDREGYAGCTRDLPSP